MRKITKDAVTAFIAGRDFRRDSTASVVENGERRLLLHGSAIVRKAPPNLEQVWRVWAGARSYDASSYPSLTTKERLNGLFTLAGLPYRVEHHKGEARVRNWETQDYVFWDGESVTLTPDNDYAWPGLPGPSKP